MIRRFVFFVAISIGLMLAPSIWAFFGPEEPPVVTDVVAIMTAVAGGVDPAPLLDELGDKYGPGPVEEATLAAAAASVTDGPENPVYGLNEPFLFAGAKFVFTGAEERSRIEHIPYDDDLFEEEGSSGDVGSSGEEVKFNVPERGKFVVVYYTFEGDIDNVFGLIDTAMFHLRDAQGGDYLILDMDPMWDVVEAESLFDVTWLLWDDPEPLESVLVFDVPDHASDFELHSVPRGVEGQDSAAVIDLGL
jgi:hypothetical protein